MSNLLIKRKGKLKKYTTLRRDTEEKKALEKRQEQIDFSEKRELFKSEGILRESTTEMPLKQERPIGISLEQQDSMTRETTPFVQCPSCKEEYSKRALRENLYVCPNCGFHYAMPPERRIVSIVDEGSFKVFRNRLPEIDPLEFGGYVEKKQALREKTKAEEAVLTGVGSIGGNKAVIAVMNSRFLMGSMGIALGEMVTQAIEYADKNKLPLIIFTASGGARMQEGILSLMQMAKTSAAMERFQSHGGLYIAVMTHPTTGGVSASFAGLGDITLAEPGALIGFAGPRVIEQTIRQKLPEGFQRAEYLEEHGFVDQVVSRMQMRQKLVQILDLHS